MVMATAPSLFLFSSIQIGVHLALILAVGKLLGIQRKDVLLASNANVGGKAAMTSFFAFLCIKNVIVYFGFWDVASCVKNTCHCLLSPFCGMCEYPNLTSIKGWDAIGLSRATHNPRLLL